MGSPNTKHFENGIVATTAGGSTDISGDIFVTGDVYWVDSVNGNDGNAGTNRNAPKATLSNALGVVQQNGSDLVIIEANHAETIGSSIALTDEEGVRIFGLGSGSTKPSFTCSANIDMFDIQITDVEFHNLRFPVGTTANRTAIFNLGASRCKITNCDFLLGEFDPTTITVPAAGDHCTIEGCTFTISADGPDTAIAIETATSLGLEVISCTFDGGDYNFDDAAIYSTSAHPAFLYKGCTLTNKAHIIHTQAAEGMVVGVIAGDGSRVQV